MSDVSMCNQLLVAYQLCLEKFGTGRELNQGEIEGLSSQGTLSFVAESFHVLQMDSIPMSDVSMCNQLLVAQLCHPMPC
jgi:hypothetical protein